MNKSVALSVAALAAFALWLYVTRKTVETQVQNAVEVAGVPIVHYTPGDIIVQPNPYGNTAHNDFDWMGASDCHSCGGEKTDILILDSFHTEMRTLPGYVFVPDIVMPGLIKGAPTLVQNSPAPIPPRYVAPVPEFWWGWDGMSRRIFTSDGANLRTGSSNMLYQIWEGSGYSDGKKAVWTLFNPITAIKYNGQLYRLNAAKSSGL